MRILHVIPSISPKSGGPGQAIFPMCRALLEQGIDVVLATTDEDWDLAERRAKGKGGSGKGLRAKGEEEGGMGKGQRAKGEALAAKGKEQSAKGAGPETEMAGVENSSPLALCPLPVTLNGVPIIFFPVQGGGSYKYSRPFAAWLMENVSTFDAVHIHAVFNHASIAAARACRKHGVPYVVRPLGTLDPWSLKQKPLRKKLFWHAAVKRMLKSAAAIHYTANEEKRAVEASLGLNHGSVIPLGVDVTAPEVSTNLHHGPDYFENEEHPYVLVLSRLHPKKALEILIEAFVSVVQLPEFQSWRLVIAGDGTADYVTSLKRGVEAHGATKSVIFTGWLDDEKKESALRDASLLALVSYQENFGLCVMESLAHGVPVLVSPHVNLATDIDSAKAGWVATVDTESIKTALVEALSSKHERQRRGLAGRDLASKFSWPTIAASLSQLYKSILPKKSGSELIGSPRSAKHRRLEFKL